MEFEGYKNRFSIAELDRTETGVLTIRLHSDGGVFEWGRVAHSEMPELLMCVRSDRANRVVVLTGTGDHFIATAPERARPLVEGKLPASFWEDLMWEATLMVDTLLDVGVPIIAAVNGPCDVHSELPMFSDIVLCTPDTYFTDKAHFQVGLVPGDGAGLAWQLLLGPSRGRYFALTGERLSAQEARQLGAVAEVLESDQLMGRAYELAEQIASKAPAMVRYTRALGVRPLKRAVHDDLHIGLAFESLASWAGQEYYVEQES